MGKFIPIWIIGAPFIFIVIDWMRTPKPGPRDDVRGLDRAPLTPAASAASPRVTA